MTRETSRSLCVTAAPSADKRAGFSLTELLVAIGVLGIGMTMVAALFVTGLAQVRLSLGVSESSVVAANGIAVAKMFVTAGDVPGTTLTVIADGSHTTKISADFQKSPYGDPDTNRGFVILARECGAEAYQLVSVAYARTGGGNVTAVAVTTSSTNANQITFTSSTNLNVGSPVIVAASGEYARIVSLSGSTATLDHELAIGNGATAYVIVESTGGSPATGVRVSRTALKP